MSIIQARVLNYKKSQNLHLVEFECNTQILTMMSLELNKEIKPASLVKLIVKPTHIAISKNFSSDISHQNRLKTKVDAVDDGKLLSSVKLDFEGFMLESIITLDASKRLNLKKGDEVLALIQASELSILEIIR